MWVPVQGASSSVDVLVSELEAEPALLGLCAGYEQGRWRQEELARWMFENLTSFALSWSERQRFDERSGARLMRRAAKAVYDTERYAKRGEFGELLLHAIAVDHFGTVPAVAKLFFKDAANDTVKGFDAVHVLEAPDGELELWLGEAKFYGRPAEALRAAAGELVEHFDGDYLRREFIAVTGKLDPQWPHATRVRKLLDEDRSLDELFGRIRVPVLVTYDSAQVAGSTARDDAYLAGFEREVRRLHETFAGHELPADVAILLILVPLAGKTGLREELHRRLIAWQSL